MAIGEEAGLRHFHIAFTFQNRLYCMWPRVKEAYLENKHLNQLP